MAIHITSQTKSLRLRPTSNAELRSLIEQELERQGPDADLNFIDVSFVKDMSYLFEGCDEFVGTGLENWDVGNVYNMSHMFEDALSFNGDLSKWNVSNVTTMSWMFESAISFTGIGVENWDTGNVVCMYRMFNKAKVFNGNISRWNVSKVVDMRWMFDSARLFTGTGLENWDISNVKRMDCIFYNTKLDVYTVFYKQFSTMPY